MRRNRQNGDEIRIEKKGQKTGKIGVYVTPYRQMNVRWNEGIRQKGGRRERRKKRNGGEDRGKIVWKKEEKNFLTT